jgi:GDP-4-dehydro-6-deoxy-D-mannose reductase
MKTILVTGAGGFVGRHLLAALGTAFPESRIVGAGMPNEADFLLDVTNRGQVFGVFKTLQPDVCIHLAGIAAIGAAKQDPGLAWAVNLHGALNVADAILANARHCRMIFASSAECYGASFRSGRKLDETAPLAPMNLYAATKAAADLALGAKAADGLLILRLRLFNHTGPAQREDFVVPAFAGQIARIEAGLAAPEILVGALTPERDFLDIRDVCAAYVASVAQFDTIPNNQILNIASGGAVTIGTILDLLIAKASRKITIRQDSARLRPIEIDHAAGDAARAAEVLGWRPVHSLDDTLDSVLAFARREVR